MLVLTIEKHETVTLELPDGRTCSVTFLSKPRSNIVRLGLECPEDVLIERVPKGIGSQDDGLSQDGQRAETHF